MMAFHGSSFFLSGMSALTDWRPKLAYHAHLMPFTAQSNVEKSPPQTPKLPPSTGARALIAVIAPMRRSPYGELLLRVLNAKP